MVCESMEKTTELLSVVVPVFGCQSSLVELCERLKSNLLTLTSNYEIILVNDDSPDVAWITISLLSKINQNIKCINLSSIFGQHHSITAGLDYTEGDWVVVMDCDLQDRPEEIPKLYEKALEGFDVVFGNRVVRQDNWFKRKSSLLFYKIYDYLTDHVSDYTVANFSISSTKVIEGFRQMREQNRLFPLFIQWMGYDTRSEEHTSELQSRVHLVCRLLLEKKKNSNNKHSIK